MEQRSGLVVIILASLLFQAGLSVWDTDPHPESPGDSLSAFTVPEDFALKYSVKDYNESGVIVYQSTLDLNSNGSARFVDSWTGQAGFPGNDVAVVLDRDLINHTREAMDEDSLCSYNGTYNDANWHNNGFAKHVDEFFIETHCGTRSLKFLGDAMIGILPRTFVALEKLIWQIVDPGMDVDKISVEVSASLGPDAMLSVSAVVRNDATHEYSMSAVCEEIWPIKIVRMNGCGVVLLPASNILPTCVVTVGPGASYPFEPQTWNASGLAKGSYVVMASPGLLGVTVIEISQDLGHVPSAPKVYVDVSESLESDGSSYDLDASASCDVEDIGTDLEVRWDWYSDGTWDTGWSFEKTAEYTFANQTGYNFTLEVRDTDGLSSSVSFSMSMNEGSTTALLPSAFALIVVAVLAIVVFFAIKKRKS